MYTFYTVSGQPSGSGKSNAINQILKATRPIGKKTIVIDTTGGYVARFYNPETDKLLNPFDERSQTWNIFDECIEDYDFMEFAESLIPPSKRDEFWVKAAQQLLATAADKLKEEGKMTIGALLDILLTKPLDEAAEDFKGTNVVTYFDPESGKMAHGIRATLIGALWSLKYIEEAESYFSIRKWVQDPSETGWLFICCSPAQRNVLRPLMTGWLSIAIKSLMAMPEDITRRVWFIMDEIASLNYVPCLVGAMQEVRKYGGSCLLGMQNFGQIHKIYGHDDCNTLFDLAGTKIGLSSTGDSATQLSKSFGQQEVIESIENLSYGAHEYRDSTSLSRQRQVRATVSPTNLMMLNPFEAYIKFPRNLPITKIKFSLQKLPLQAEIYVKKSKEIFPKNQESKLISLSNSIYKESEEERDVKKVSLENPTMNEGVQMEVN